MNVYLVVGEFFFDLECGHQFVDRAPQLDAERRRPDVVGPLSSDEVLPIVSPLDEGVEGEVDEVAPSLDTIRRVEPEKRDKRPITRVNMPGRQTRTKSAGQA